MSVRPPWGNNLVLLSFKAPPVPYVTTYHIVRAARIGHAPSRSTLMETDGKLFFSFLFFAFILLVAETNRDVCQMTLGKPFAALIPSVKANQRRVQQQQKKNGDLCLFVFPREKL